MVRPHDGRIDDQILEVGIVREGRKNAMPHTALAPTIETPPYAVPTSECQGQIAPRRAGTRDPQNAFDKHAIVLARPAGIALLSYAKGLDTRPLLILQYQPNSCAQDCLPRICSLESQIEAAVNPLTVHRT